MYPTPAQTSSTSSGVAVVLIEDDSRDGAALCSRVDLALKQGFEVWLRSPLLVSLIEALGREYKGQLWLVLEPKINSNKSWEHRFIWCRDILLSALALMILCLLLAVIALAVKFSSSGPVFFTSTVVGKGRSTFVWRKFRSMQVIPEAEDAEQRRLRYQAFVQGSRSMTSSKAPGKLIDERRVTRVGRIIRKYSLDELPQLWNVLRGQMSLVGPRPCSPDEAEHFTGWRSRRFAVKPGLTGVWQVFGRGRASFDETAAMDVYYLYRRSFSFDLYLIFKTVFVVCTAKGAL